MADAKPTAPMCGYDEATGEARYFDHPLGEPLPKGMADHPDKAKANKASDKK